MDATRPPKGRSSNSRPDPPTLVCDLAPALRDLATPIAQLSADPANARLHDDRSIEVIKASLRRFGQQKPVVVDKSGVVIAGNGMLEAARQLGWTHIAAARSELAGVDRAAYAIADNRAPEFSRWDEEILRQVLASLPEEAAQAAGFTHDELQELLKTEDDAPLVEDDVPEPLAAAVTEVGDIWEMGPHRLLCGDSTRAEHVDLLLGGRKASLVATDPPYLVEYTGKRVGGRGKDWSSTYREIEIEDAGEFYRGVFSNVVRVVAPNAAIYCWHAHKRLMEILEAWRELDILDHQQIVWVKPVPVFGSVFWHFRHEPCIMGWRRGSKPPHDGRHDGDSVWLAQGVKVPLEQLSKTQIIRLLKEECTVWEIDWEGKGRPVGNEHPTQKPIEIFARPMRKHTKPGDLCYEPFSGSGSQLVAAEQLGRHCYAMEIEPVFVDVAVRRWQALTGKTATLAGDGRSWAEIAKARGVPMPEDPPCPASPSAPALKPDAAPSPTAATASSTARKGKAGKRPRPRARRVATARTGAS